VISDVGRGNASRYSRLLGWWYGCIAAGFLLLALFYAVHGAGPSMVLLRVGIAAGFAALAYAELHGKRR
jgi:hypothetical protein